MVTTMKNHWCFLLSIILLEINSSTVYGPVWSYDNEAEWPGAMCRDGGRRQSPIDIRSNNVVRDFNKEFIQYGPLQFNGHQKVMVSGINNGHTVQFSTEGDAEMHPILTGGPLKNEYRLEQLHFHWLSEHSVNGVKFPIELHMVHVRADLDVTQALKKRDGLAIVAIFGTIKTDPEDIQLDITDAIMQYLPNLTDTGHRVSGIVLDMKSLLGTETESYYTYAGSLTSPQCNEAVIWIILTSPLVFSDSQYFSLSKINGGRHNYRSLQRLDKHQVFTPPSVTIHTPHVVKFLERVVKIVSDFFRNVTSFMSKSVRRVR